ncbi:TetR/AcrR family transcriptional regulator [Amycolatopsis taiwanensis]|uniref:TetR family transcriptional regulator n=1 Tax=Amycolatopsis taiwanensis TaxID=342230 RepID=A0A9W6RBG6_9PSEU|nr:TetR/AcrR family transcriptional regulator [Amycolatopsis taiwanensis]GLY71007.1 TetR family transcriptional regulator [Amycolatopsis taiwanensis]
MSVNSESRLRILLAAERLFAERGIDGVSLREIGSASGHRNNSAVQYHFGTKDSLLASLYELRMAPLNERRKAVLRKIRKDGRQGDLRALVEAYVLPLAESVSEAEESSWYARFANRYVLSRKSFPESFRDGFASGVYALHRMIAACLEELSVPVRQERIRQLQLLVVGVLADLERRRDEEQLSPEDAQRTVAELVETAVALLAAPASAGTQR